jgi:hypothetical protein
MEVVGEKGAVVMDNFPQHLTTYRRPVPETPSGSVSVQTQTNR